MITPVQRKTARPPGRAQPQASPSTPPRDCFELSTPAFPPLIPARLAEGVPFANGYDVDALSTLGLPVSHEGLTRMYESCLPGSHAFVSVESGDRSSFCYLVSWRDHEGNEIAHTESNLAHHPDGSLELHRSCVVVAPECRGQALNIKVLEREAELLRACSHHKHTRITLEAGSMPVNGHSEQLGAYTWGHYGFDFADQQPGGPSTLLTYDTGRDFSESELSEADCMRKRFREWVAEKFPGASNRELVAQLQDFASRLKHPWEMANLKVPGHKVPVEIGGRQVDCELGKAFMTSPSCCFWAGSLLVNDPKFAGAPIAREVWGSQLAAAETHQAEQRQQLLEQLDKDPETALATLRRRGTADFAEAVEALAARRPEWAEKVQDTLATLRGERLTHFLKSKSWGDECSGWVLGLQKARSRNGWNGYVQGHGNWLQRLGSWVSERFS